MQCTVTSYYIQYPTHTTKVISTSPNYSVQSIPDLVGQTETKKLQERHTSAVLSLLSDSEDE